MEKSEIKKSSIHTLAGQRFGDYCVTSGERVRVNGVTFIEVECSHGKSLVNLDNLKRGRQIGCKLCYKERNSITNFESEQQRKLRRRVDSLLGRCLRPSVNGYDSYSKLGVYQGWVDDPMALVKYLQDLPGCLSPGAQIDRIDNSIGYFPGNIRWASAKTNGRNRNNNVIVEWDGTRMTIGDFTERYTTHKYDRVLRLFKAGWSLSDIINYKPNDGRRYGRSKRKYVEVEWNNEVLRFKDFVSKYTKLSYVQANKLRLRGWSPARLVSHVPWRREASV